EPATSGVTGRCVKPGYTTPPRDGGTPATSSVYGPILTLSRNGRLPRTPEALRRVRSERAGIGSKQPRLRDRHLDARRARGPLREQPGDLVEEAGHGGTVLRERHNGG